MNLTVTITPIEMEGQEPLSFRGHEAGLAKAAGDIIFAAASQNLKVLVAIVGETPDRSWLPAAMWLAHYFKFLNESGERERQITPDFDFRTMLKPPPEEQRKAA